VDLEITGDEGLMVLEALRYMGNFQSEGRREYFGINSPLSFNEHPNVPASKIDDDLTVYAVAPLFAVTFTQGRYLITQSINTCLYLDCCSYYISISYHQPILNTILIHLSLYSSIGVNEMQTLANLSSSRDVLKQVEINTASMTRMEAFYKHYKAALEYQMDHHTADLVASFETPLPADSSALIDIARPSNNAVNAMFRSTQQFKSKSVRQSINNRTTNASNQNGATYNASVMTSTIETIKQKVVSSMDRYGGSEGCGVSILTMNCSICSML